MNSSQHQGDNLVENDKRSTMNQQHDTTTAAAQEEPPLLVEAIAGQCTAALPKEFTPGEDDVIIGRGKTALLHVGNARFRQLIDDRLEEYSNATAKQDKSYILSDIVNEIRRRTPQGGFVKREPATGRWYEVGDFLAREKTSQTFRDALHDKYKSSNAAKKKRRLIEQSDRLFKKQSSESSLYSTTSTSSMHHSNESLNYDPNNNSISNNSFVARPPPMVVMTNEPSQEALLDALDAELAVVFNQQLIVQPVVEVQPQPQPVEVQPQPAETFSQLQAFLLKNTLNRQPEVAKTTSTTMGMRTSSMVHIQEDDHNNSPLSPMGDGYAQSLLNSLSNLDHSFVLEPTPMLEDYYEPIALR